jgi:hypothetical protein
MFGPRSERSQRLIDQMELQLEEIAAGLGEDAASWKRRASRFAALRGARRRGGTFPDDPCRGGASFTRCLFLLCSPRED